MSDAVLRAMVAEDWPEVSRIFVAGMETGMATFETEAPDWESWDAGHLAEPRIVAIVEGRVHGFAALSPVSRRACYHGVAEISIYADRGLGLGGPLLKELIHQAEAAGLWTLQSTIFAENAASIRLHLAHGFRLVGRRDQPAQRLGEWHDTVIYERRAITEPYVYRQSIEIAASAEEIWAMITTADGLKQWYAPEARASADTVWVSWGDGMDGESKITAWEPPRRVRWEWGNSPLEYHVEDGRLTIENSTTSHGTKYCLPHAWPLFLLALKHSAERRAVRFENITVFRTTATPRPQVFARVLQQMGTLKASLRLMDPEGYAAFETPGALLCIFCEGGGADTMLTLMWLVYDGATTGLRERWEAIADAAVAA